MSMGTGYWGTPINVQSQSTSPTDTDRSTVETLAQMAVVAKVASSSPAVTGLVDSLVRTLPRNPTNMDLVRTMFWWIKNHITFREDEQTLVEQLGYTDPFQELLISPEALLQMPQPMGDCDDYSMLVASIMMASKIPVWFVAVAVDQNEPMKFSHVYTKVLADGRYVMIDASHGTVPGWETDNVIYRRLEWFVG